MLMYAWTYHSSWNEDGGESSADPTACSWLGASCMVDSAGLGVKRRLFAFFFSLFAKSLYFSDVALFSRLSNPCYTCSYCYTKKLIAYIYLCIITSLEGICISQHNGQRHTCIYMAMGYGHMVIWTQHGV